MFTLAGLSWEITHDTPGIDEWFAHWFQPYADAIWDPSETAKFLIEDLTADGWTIERKTS